MTYWRLTIMDLQELLRRLRAGESRNAIVRAMHLSPNTVTTYRRWAEQQQLLTGTLPDLMTLDQLREQTVEHRPRHPNESSLASYRTEVAELVEQGYKPRVIWRMLHRQHPEQFNGSESALRRLVKSVRASQPPAVTMRLETTPGEVAQADFGFIGYLRHPQTQQPCKAWVFVMTLAWSRHQYAEIVGDQTTPTWLLCHQHAFEYFSGAPQRVVLDNLKAAIIQAYTVDHDPEVQQSYRECAEHYHFLIDPCLPRKPQHKGKVERGGVGYLKQSFVPLLLEGATLTEANQQLRQWLFHTAGLRVHGTTHETPLSRFEHTERAALQPLPSTAYDPAVWKSCKLHRDCHVTFEKSYYSAPYRFVGQKLWIRAGLQEVRLFTERFELVATHSRASHVGQRFTQPDHLPTGKAQALTLTRQTCQGQADAIGPSTAQVIAELLASRPIDRFRSAVLILHLAERYTPTRLEAACTLALAHGDANCRTLQRILRDGLETTPLPVAPAVSTEPLTFARNSAELAEAILGGTPWN